MSQQSKIEWTRSTFNPWIGCTRVSPGCDNCYAAASTPARVMRIKWGPGEPRQRTSAANWNQVRRWNRQAAATGEYWPVFTASLADVFDNEVPEAWRGDFWALVRECGALTFLVLTKRIGNVRGMLPVDWADGYANVRLGITVVNQAEANRDIPKLLATPAALRWLSMEPLLSPVDLRLQRPVREDDRQDMDGWCSHITTAAGAGIKWVVVGGESGAGARPMHPDWARSLRDQCAAAGVAFLHKQNGEWLPAKAQRSVLGKVLVVEGVAPFTKDPAWHHFEDGQQMARVGKKAAGRLLDGMLHDGYPKVA